MNLLQKTQKICQENKIEPARSKGQNFLINEGVYDDIIVASDLQAADVVLEVGPGLGFLTRKLAEKVQKVIAIELDDVLAALLVKNLTKEGIKNVEVRNENILDLNLQGVDFVANKYKIVANLPYNITSVFLRRFLETDNRPELMVLMLQKEVAERIIAKPGQMSILANSVQFFANGDIVQVVPKNDFWPAPKVDSAVIKLKTFESVEDAAYQKRFFRLVKHGFVSKRKMLKNNLSSGYHVPQEKILPVIEKVGLNEKARAQELALDDWKRLLVEVEANML
ncbi:16S rRNA (adenine(1518)-N(6)/adenine(1519)-N(6))-dimethyltransferase RsmA [Candidatus Parcubacteria bacterium]|nr:ribosomal RNA small subunit methyltransferase A [Patescibacteria group bacterium]MBU4309523.1 ribosomal RNA small subunit methyltransferase A [Patescibacteria group bacterium]MBU4432369.1 ribosomal RNA small subunit methyltransferase A [Patescibacteria group bacterium]MBU4577229.1 ribosomal RNA small subunit methyltransferase A [Patescibacteria group bacterium]MCG2696875.1 16S rRNA (adenine(1518)-N(6)/adenine(1519)-N(6))-dimethyltransferase RsmA [Candidatus Parcubacteria bacterium]